MSDISVTDIQKSFDKKHGTGLTSSASNVTRVGRIPTGIFPLDLALGGGIPTCRLSIIYGQESSGKTNVCLRLLLMHMTLWPDKTCVFVDVEHSFDPDWAKQFGVDLDKLLVVRPDYAEQAIDMILKLVEADDIGMIVIDSLGAFVAAKEIENSSETKLVGGTALLQTLFSKKVVAALNVAERQGRIPTVVAINQIRFKIGVMYGDPETQPGGKALMHAAALVLRLYGKPVRDAKIAADLPVARDTSFILKKYKFKIVADSGKFVMATIPHRGMRVGETDDWNTVASHLKDYEQLVKGDKGKGWVMLGEKFNTLADARDRLDSDPVYGVEVRKAIIERVCKDNGV